MISMNKLIPTLTLVFCFFFFPQINAQDYDAKVLEDLKSYHVSLISKNFDQAVDFTYFNIVSSAGGRASMLDILKEERQNLKSQGIVVTDYLAQEVLQTIEHEEEIHCIVTQEVTLKIGSDRFRGKEYVLAISSDKGLSWTFVELKSQDLESLKHFVPFYSEEMTIPQSEDFIKFD